MVGPGILILLCFIVLCAILTWMKPRELGPGWAWLRLFFPSWRFFDDFNQTPRLFFRVARSPGQFGSWSEAIPAETKRSWTIVFSNPRGNLKLAAHSAVDRLLEEVARASSTDEIQRTVSYRLVENLVRERVPESVPEFQFKISLDAEASDDLLLSPLIKKDER